MEWNCERQTSTSEAEIEEKVDVPYIYMQIKWSSILISELIKRALF